MNDTMDKLIQLASKRFGVEPVSLKPEDDIFQKFGINSIDALNLLSDLEREFDVEIPDYELQGVHTLSGLAQVIQRRL